MGKVEQGVKWCEGEERKKGNDWLKLLVGLCLIELLTCPDDPSDLSFYT